MKLFYSFLSVVIIGVFTYFIYDFIDKKYVERKVVFSKRNILTQLPNLRLVNIQDEDIELKQFSDKVILLNFWASWCEPCKQEFPSLIRLIESFKGKVVLIAISGDHDEISMLSFLKKYKIQSDYLHVIFKDGLALNKKLNIRKLPETYIAKNQKVLEKVDGLSEWDSTYWVERINNYISSK